MLGTLGDVAAKYGITVVVEPLQTKETNLINTVAEGIEIVKKVDRPNVKCLADFSTSTKTARPSTPSKTATVGSHIFIL